MASLLAITIAPIVSESRSELGGLSLMLSPKRLILANITEAFAHMGLPLHKLSTETTLTIIRREHLVESPTRSGRCYVPLFFFYDGGSLDYNENTFMNRSSSGSNSPVDPHESR